ncbi:MAG TPA: glutathione peroxidase [Steroidobacteraceae bacterium]|nr:glutathione peroxidase [Steroidobacteraceae bacterium]
MAGIYDYSLKSLDGANDALGKLRGKVTLVVNVASKCGLTPQYQGLEDLYRELKGQDFAIVGLPCNQFGGQEPGSATDIQAFCSTSYGVSFPMTEKIDVNGPGRHPLYAWLTDPANGFPGDIQWNFEKFLVGRDGKVLHRYPPTTKPEDKGLLGDIADAL